MRRLGAALLFPVFFACAATPRAPDAVAKPAAPAAASSWVGVAPMPTLAPQPAEPLPSAGPRDSPPPRGPTPAERDQFSAIALLCTTDIHAGGASCSALGPTEAASCTRVCKAAAEEKEARHEAETLAAARAEARAARVQMRPPRPEAPASPPAPLEAQDSYDVALRECVRRVRDSGGAEKAECRFERPLDQMDFGQRHCDARCASMARAFGQ